jgi:hypothetical protein
LPYEALPALVTAGYSLMSVIPNGRSPPEKLTMAWGLSTFVRTIACGRWAASFASLAFPRQLKTEGRRRRVYVKSHALWMAVRKRAILAAS